MMALQSCHFTNTNSMVVNLQDALYMKYVNGGGLNYRPVSQPLWNTTRPFSCLYHIGCRKKSFVIGALLRTKSSTLSAWFHWPFKIVGIYSQAIASIFYD